MNGMKIVAQSIVCAALLGVGTVNADNRTRNSESGQFELGGKPSSLSNDPSKPSNPESRSDCPAGKICPHGSPSKKIKDQTKVLGDDESLGADARGQWRGREETDTSATLTGKRGDGMPPDEFGADVRRNPTSGVPR